jgi:predicted MPP superfamily phosphohydrolase
LLAVLLAAALSVGCATHASLRTTRYSVPAPVGSPFVIALVTDLHGDVYGRDQTPLLDRLREEEPDIIVLAGDIYDDKAPPLGARLLLSGSLAIAPVFYVTGNHEHGMGRGTEIRREVEEAGAAVLSDSYVTLDLRGDSIVIAGVEDPGVGLDNRTHRQPDAEATLARAASLAGYRILLCHRPELALRYAGLGFDLILSGHTHGGQVRFAGRGLYAPGQGLFPRYSGGVYTLDADADATRRATRRATLVVSRGLTTRRPRWPRIFNPPELVIITVSR